MLNANRQTTDSKEADFVGNVCIKAKEELLCEIAYRSSTYASNGHVEAPALGDGDLVRRAGRADVGPGVHWGAQPERESGRGRRRVLDPAATRLLPKANTGKLLI